MNHIAKITLAGSFALAIAGCGAPGGLSKEEYDALPAAERAHLRIKQDQLNEQRMENSRRQMDRLNKDSNHSNHHRSDD